MKRIYPDDPADYRCVIICRHPKCKAHAMTNGYCCEHYLKALDKFEAQSRRHRLIVRDVIRMAKKEGIHLTYQ